MDCRGGKGGFSVITDYGLPYPGLWRGIHPRRPRRGRCLLPQRMDGVQKCVRHSTSTSGRSPGCDVLLPIRSRNDSGRHLHHCLFHSRIPAKSHVEHDVTAYSVIVSCLRPRQGTARRSARQSWAFIIQKLSQALIHSFGTLVFAVPWLGTPGFTSSASG